jgi:hypothetical protein
MPRMVFNTVVIYGFAVHKWYRWCLSLPENFFCDKFCRTPHTYLMFQCQTLLLGSHCRVKLRFFTFEWSTPESIKIYSRLPPTSLLAVWTFPTSTSSSITTYRQTLKPTFTASVEQPEPASPAKPSPSSHSTTSNCTNELSI